MWRLAVRWFAALAAGALVLAAGMGTAQPAPKRLALVIGNGAYQVDTWKLRYLGANGGSIPAGFKSGL